MDSEKTLLISDIQYISSKITTTLRAILALICLSIPSYMFAAPADDFVTTWKTDNPGSSGNTSITIPTVAGGYSYQVDWNNDGDFLDADETAVNTGSITHDFGTAGTYTIRIKGNFPRIYFNNDGDKLKIVSLDQWGTGTWTSMENAFYGAQNLVIPATDTPNFSSTTSMAHMFAEATLANPVTSDWNVSSVTNMSSMFQSTTVAAPDTSSWNVSSVTDMKFMFYDATSANPDTSNWIVSNVTNMSSMFEATTVANPDTSDWIVSNVIDMRYMFASAASANPDTSDWDVSNVTIMNSMFAETTSANPDTSEWDVSSVTDMGFMFSGATAANPNTSDWIMTNTRDIQSMFELTTVANPDTTSWDVSNVINMSFMFSHAESANPNTSNWITSSANDMSSMFEFATAANPDTGSWDISNVNDMTAMFSGVTLPTPRYDTLLSDFNAQTLTDAVTFDGGNSTYCFSANERANMMSNDNWIITDGGQNCDYLLDEALEDSASIGGSNNSNGVAITALELSVIGGITNVLTANEALYQAAIANETDFSNPPTTVEVQSIIDTVNALAEVLEDSNSTGGAINANATPVTTAQLAAITGITNVLTANEALYQAAIANETDFSNPPKTVEVQSIIDTVNALAEVLEDSNSTGGAINANATPVTTAQLAAITGITNVLTANEALYQAAIANETDFSNPPTTVEVQSIIDTVNALAEVLEDSNSTGGTGNLNDSAVTTVELAAITGITNVLTANEALYQAAIANETDFSNPPTAIEVQSIIDSVNANVELLNEVLEDSNSTGGAINANATPVTTAQLAAITGITNVLTANEALYQAAIANETDFSNPPTTVEVQSIIDTVNALAEVLEDSNSTGGAINANATPVTTAQLAAITGITNVLTANEALYQAAIANETDFSNPPKTVEVQSIIDTVNALAEVLEDSNSTGGAINANATPVTTAQLAAITGITNVLTANEALYQAAIANETDFSNPPTTVEVQSIIDSVNASVESLNEVLEDSNSTGGTGNLNDSAVTTVELAAITGITNVLTANEALYQAAITNETGFSNPPTTVEVQSIIDSVNANVELLNEVLEDSNSTGGAINANATPVTTAQLAAITGITNVLTANEALYQAAIANETDFSNPPTTVEVQSIIDTVNALAEVLEDSNSTGGAINANATPVTTAQLAAITGITNVLTANEALYQAAIANETDFSNPPTTVEVQSIIDTVNALAEVLEDSNSTGGTGNLNDSAVTTVELAAITGITNVLTANEAFYQAAIANETGFSNPPTAIEVQSIIDSVNANVELLNEVLEDSNSTGGAINANATPVTTAQLAAITGITNVLTANEALYQAAIANETDFSNPPTTVEVQSIIDTVNALAAVLEDSNSTGGAINANATPVTTAQLAAITGITNVLTANEALYQAAIANETDFSNPPTTVEVQSIIDTVNALAEVLEDSNSTGGAINANATPVTTAQLAAITGITNVLTANEALYQAAIANETDFSNPPKTVEVQSIIDTVNALAEVLEDSNSTGGAINANATPVTTAQLAAITGITNVLTANEALYQAAIANETDFSNPPTTVEVQSIIDTVNALAEVLEDSNSTGGTGNLNDSPVTTVELAAITGITNVLTANEALYQAAIANETDFSNPPTTVEVQSIIDSVNASVESLNEVLEDSNSTGGTGNLNDSAVTTVELAAITGITNVLTANEALYQAAITNETGFSNPPTTVEVQSIIDSVNASVESLNEVLEDSNSTGGTGNLNDSAVTTVELAAITGITNVLTANEAFYQAAIANETGFSNPPTAIEVQSIIDSVNANVELLNEVLEDSNSTGGAINANATPVTTAQLAAITGITNVLTANEALYQAAIANETDFSNPPKTVEVQSIIDTVNALAEVLEDSNSTGGTGNLNDSAVTTVELAAITGITNVLTANEAFYQAAIANETGFSNPPTAIEVQSIIDSVNANVELLNEVLEDSNSTGGAINANATPVTTAQLAAITGITNVLTANEALYQAAIANETGFSNPPTLVEVQKIIDAVNTNVAILVEVLEDSSSTQGQNNANGVAVTATELATITGITAVDYANESLYQLAIASEKDFSQPPTLAQIQAIIDSVNSQVIAMNLAISMALSEVLETSASPGGGNANQQSVTVEQLELIAQAIDPTLINQYNLAIESATTLSSPPTIAQVQTIIDAVNQASSAIDTDGDGLNNDSDTDDDNDGYSDIIEIANGTDPLDVNSVPDYIDTDGDTIVDSIERNQDTDNDGIPDILDLDSDNDGLYDIIEAAVDPTEVYLLDADNDGRVDAGTQSHISVQVNEIVDTDGDSVADFRDTDSDNDGLLDRDERYKSSDQTNRVVGLSLKAQTSVNNNGLLANIIHAPEDHDQDGIINNRDLDSDNDGIVDTIEAGNKDDDNNGIIDSFTDNDLNGVDDAVFITLIATTDTDNDGLKDFLDLDSDQDGLSDLQETGGIDENLDGKVDQFVDFNADGWTDLGHTQPVQLIDTDNDNIEDFRDRDSDNDGISDAAEIGHIDADNDGVIDALSDIDHDNIPDSVDVDQTGGVDSDDDGIDDRFGASTNTQMDTDGDGISDEFDHDLNGDGWVIFEGTPTSAAALPDADGDGRPDVTDAIHDEDVVHVSVSGGGCTVTSKSGFDPLFLLILFTSLLYFMKRNRNVGQNHTTTTLSIVVLGGLLLSITAEAGQKKAYLGVGAGISKLEPTLEGHRYQLDDTTGTTSHFLLGYRFKQDWALELEYADLGRATMKPSASVGYNVTSASGLYQLWQAQKTPVSIFGRLGVGAISSHSSTLVVEKDHNMLWLFGAGIETDINRLLTLRADAVNYDKDARRFSVSLLYNFSEPAPAQPVQAKINRNVTNEKTQPVEIERTNIQLQNKDDLQEQNALVAASSVHFEFDSQEATLEEYRKLEAVLHWMQADSRRTITISGHSDNIGSEEYNLQISKQRAQSVSDYFSSRGISETRMLLLYLGQSDPVASNSSEEGRRLNRRVTTEPNIE